MVQISEYTAKLWQPWLTSDEARLSKCREEAGGKWRRPRHRKDPPEYSSHFPKVGEPIDLSTRKLRGSPPSYSQTIAIQKQARNSVVMTPLPPSTNNRTENPVLDGGVCDPMIDEHFRRSLGKDYLSSTSQDGNSDDDLPTTDSSSLSVDDHFAKALGDTWLELQRENELKKKEQKSPEKKETLRRTTVPT